MSRLVVAGKDFREMARTRLLQGLSVAVVVAIVATAAGRGLLDPGSGFADFLILLGSVVRWLVPVVALVAGFNAVVGERESGTLKFLLALPHSRHDVVVGKVIGRTGAITVPILLGIVVAGIVALASYPAVPLATYAAFAVLSALLGVAFTSLAVAVSAAVDSTVRSLSISTTAVVVFLFVWEPALEELGALLYGPESGQLSPAIGILQQLNPVGAYTTLVSDLAASAPASLASVVLLGLWAVVPLAVGYHRFRETELA